MKKEYPGNIQSIPEIRKDLHHTADKQGIPDSELKQMTFIAEELFSRIVRFNADEEPGKVRIGLAKSESSMVLELGWMGAPFNPADETLHETHDPMDGDEGGMGLVLIRTFADAIEYSRQAGQNNIYIRKSIRTTN